MALGGGQRMMPPEYRQLVDWALAHGWRRAPDARKGHPRIEHVRTGRAITLPSTPSDWRGLANSRADIERITGERVVRPRAGRYRHTGQNDPAFTLEDARADQERRESLRAELAGHRERWQHLRKSVRTASYKAEMRWLADRCEWITAELGHRNPDDE